MVILLSTQGRALSAASWRMGRSFGRDSAVLSAQSIKRDLFYKPVSLCFNPISSFRIPLSMDSAGGCTIWRSGPRLPHKCLQTGKNPVNPGYQRAMSGYRVRMTWGMTLATDDGDDSKAHTTTAIWTKVLRSATLNMAHLCCLHGAHAAVSLAYPSLLVIDRRDQA